MGSSGLSERSNLSMDPRNHGSHPRVERLFLQTYSVLRDSGRDVFECLREVSVLKQRSNKVRFFRRDTDSAISEKFVRLFCLIIKELRFRRLVNIPSGRFFNLLLVNDRKVKLGTSSNRDGLSSEMLLMDRFRVLS